MFLKKSLVCFFGTVFTMGLICSCGDKKTVANQNPVEEKQAEIALQLEDVVEQKTTVQRDERYGDLEKALSKMTKRFKGEVSIAEKDYDTFLSELEFVLFGEKYNAQDDISLFYLIDKTHFVGNNKGSDYVPKHRVDIKSCADYGVNKDGLTLRSEAASGLTTLAQAAKKDGVKLTVSSTYRSYSYQKQLFDYWVSVDGLEEAERESARPGTSQHQLGLAVDFAPVSDSFFKTDAGQWMYKHASEYGWSLSFPQDHEDVTGFKFESWHFRYIGVDACNLQKKWFANVQQYLMEFIDEWKKTESYISFAKENGL